MAGERRTAASDTGSTATRTLTGVHRGRRPTRCGTGRCAVLRAAVGTDNVGGDAESRTGIPSRHRRPGIG